MTHILVVTTALVVAAAGSGFLSAAQAPAKKTAWDGVYTKEQADRGATAFAASCTNCHGPMLEGRNAKALVGNTFWNDFSQRDVAYLLNYMSKNMPNNAPGTLDASTYVDLTAFILSRNEFPAGTAPLTAQAAAGVEIISKDGPRALADKTLARVVGCLAKGGSGWVVNNATAPERADPSGAAPPDLGTRALGDRSFPLLFVLTRLDRMAGHRVAVRGLLVGEDGSGGINVTEVTDVGASCQ